MNTAIDESFIWFKQSAFQSLVKEAKKKYPLETGGVLIGYFVSKNKIVITEVLGPGKLAEHEKDRFEPDQNFHEIELEKHFFNTNHKEVYLGDWHTHPNFKPYLSKIDLKTLRRIAKYKPSQLSHPLMAVLGTSNMDFKIWQYVSSTSFFWNYKVNVRECLVRFYD